MKMTGVVMSADGKKAVVLCDNGTFKRVEDKSYAVGQKIKIAEKKLYLRYLAIAAAFVLMLSAGVGAHRIYFTPTSFVYLDINPSVRLDINRFDVVISVVPLNDDAQKLLSDYSTGKSDAKQCIADIVDLCRRESYINEENTDVEIGVVSGNQKLKTEVETVSDTLNETELCVLVGDVDKSENSGAMKLGVSPLRLKAVKAYTEKFGGTLEENTELLKDMKNKEIYKMIKDAEEKVNDNSQTENVTESSDELQGPTESEKPHKPEADDKTGNSAVSENPANTDKPEKAEPSQNLEKAQNSDKTPSSGSPVKSTETEKRVRAIKAYTEEFGGTLGENTGLLKGVTNEEIYERIEQSREKKQVSDGSEEKDEADSDVGKGLENSVNSENETSADNKADEENVRKQQ